MRPVESFQLLVILQEQDVPTGERLFHVIGEKWSRDGNECGWCEQMAVEIPQVASSLASVLLSPPI